ncbi:hypothetical protein T439DRAFT_171557 [Meredithblackwellia eburnea MCA 4105]
MDDDSPWMEDEPSQISNGEQVAAQEWSRLSQRYSDAGYRDGITAGKQSKLQAGFDQGFGLASPFARRVGNLRGASATLLAILTTNAAGKHAGVFFDTQLADTSARQAVVSELRELVSALGRLDENKVLPVDQEAEDHAKSHGDEGISLVMMERKEMRGIEDLLGGMGGSTAGKEPGLEECQTRLEQILQRVGLSGVIPIRG